MTSRNVGSTSPLPFQLTNEPEEEKKVSHSIPFLKPLPAFQYLRVRFFPPEIRQKISGREAIPKSLVSTYLDILSTRRSGCRRGTLLLHRSFPHGWIVGPDRRATSPNFHHTPRKSCAMETHFNSPVRVTWDHQKHAPLFFRLAETGLKRANDKTACRDLPQNVSPCHA